MSAFGVRILDVRKYASGAADSAFADLPPPRRDARFAQRIESASVPCRRPPFSLRGALGRSRHSVHRLPMDGPIITMVWG